MRDFSFEKPYTALSAAKPRSRSALRSSTCSSPICSRSVGPPGRPFCGAIVRAVEGNDEAFKTAPRIAHAEKFYGIEQGIDGLLRRRLQHDAEQAGGSGKICFQIACPGSLSSAGCRTPETSGQVEPARHLERRALMLLAPHAERPQSAQREKHVVRSAPKPHICIYQSGVSPKVSLSRKIPLLSLKRNMEIDDGLTCCARP